MTNSSEADRLKTVRRATLSGMIGTIIEWYDFMIYATLAASVFNVLFFPALDPVTGTIAALSTFAAGFISRSAGSCSATSGTAWAARRCSSGRWC
jgi:MFS transporter, MHS family, shikimate and dehydroshikimate transport protein